MPDINSFGNEAMSTLVMRTLHQSPKYDQIASHASREAPSADSADIQQNSKAGITARRRMAEAWRGLTAPPLDTSCACEDAG